MSISIEQLESQFKHLPEVSDVFVESDGHHFRLTIISDRFEHQSKVARQKWVYAILKNFILSGELHAIEMQTWTQSEWEKQRG